MQDKPVAPVTGASKRIGLQIAKDRGLVETERANGRSIVRLTSSGHSLLKERRPGSYEALWPVPEQR
ncbi:MAG: hypothetical protein JO251_01880 [Verrucomicrobia bacterium]|nr:hypothetical protein [Verrucomicrobiota bacterium]